MQQAFRSGSTALRALAVGFSLATAACSTTEQTLTLAPTSAVAPIMSAKYAAIVVDASSGRTLYQANADAVRFPASLTKMMTLYMVFEALEQGRLTRQTEIPVSAYAASRPPTKIGFRPGDTIDVDAAIKALVTKSANDVATAFAEALGGSESQFAALMTAKARQIGMRNTVFRNASGLPDSSQMTTARDMAVLGVTLRRKFPQYYAYFSVRDFSYHGRTVKGHNRVLDNVVGADGIKTGYIRASGFNIVTSVSSGGRRLVAVVMGGDSAIQRDEHVAQLVGAYLPAAAH